MAYIEIIAIFFLIVAILILVYYFVLANSTSFNGLNLKVPSLNSESVEMPSSAKSVNITFDDDDKSNENLTSKIKGKINDYDMSSFSTDSFSKKIDAFLDQKSDQLIQDWSLATKNDLSALESRWASTNESIDDLEKRVDEFSDYTNERLDSLDDRIKALEDDKN